MAPNELLQSVLGQMQQDGDEALASLDQLLTAYGRDARLHFLRGSLLAGQERYVLALLAMQRAVEIAPDYILARFQLGFLELTSGDAQAAQATWLPLLNLPSDTPVKLFVEGLNKLIVDDFEGSIALLEEGIALNTELPPMNRDMGLLIDQMREKLASQAAKPDVAPEPADDIESGAHFLLKQYSFKDTKH